MAETEEFVCAISFTVEREFYGTRKQQLSVRLPQGATIKELRFLLATHLGSEEAHFTVSVDGRMSTWVDKLDGWVGELMSYELVPEAVAVKLRFGPSSVSEIMRQARVGLVFEEATPELSHVVELGRNVMSGSGNVSHTISAFITWPAADNFPKTRSWILHLGQDDSGAHHWLWNPARTPNPELAQLGVWCGQQAQKELPATPGLTNVITTTFESETSHLVVYIDGKVHETVEQTKFNFTGSQLQIRVGKHAGESDFPGLVRDLKIWSRALSPSEVAGLGYGIATFPETLVISA